MRKNTHVDRLSQVQYQGKVSYTCVIDDFKMEIQSCRYPFKNTFTTDGTMVFDLRNIMATMMLKRFTKKYMLLIAELGNQIAQFEQHDNMLRIKILDAAFTCLRRSVHHVTTYHELLDMCSMFSGMTKDRLAAGLMFYADAPEAAFTIKIKSDTGQICFTSKDEVA